jgi:hypothetical protein
VDLEGFSKRPPVMEGSKRNYPNRGFTVEFKDDNVTASFEEVVRYNTLLTEAIFEYWRKGMC